jgi:hypothetical protein
VLLLCFALPAVLQALFFPRWPTVQKISTGQFSPLLTEAGFDVVPFADEATKSNYHIAKSNIISYRMDNGNVLRIMHARVRERLNFSVKYISADNPSVLLKDSTLSKSNTFTLQGVVDNKPALQTCLVEDAAYQNSFGIGFQALGRAVDQRDGRSSLIPLQLIGMHPNRSYDCYLVTYIASGQRPIGQSEWISLLKAL